MTNPRCELVRDGIPDFVAGRMAPAEAATVRGHLADCEDCRVEEELVRLLYGARPEVPAGLLADIQEHVGHRRRGVTRPWWGAAAAAVAAVALGIGVTARSSSDSEDVPAYVAELQGLTPWVSDDGLIAGAPALDDLSDEDLQTLLDEMGAGGSGGSA